MRAERECKQAEPRRRWEEKYVLATLLQAPLSRVPLTQGEGVGWGGVDEATVWWMDELHPISTGFWYIRYTTPYSVTSLVRTPNII